ncbi:unnamed protein product [Staurois parvus]|uniref:Uncharacterized protein n=1 Tax=Staurois parvus TaxID=386267 RepID=A0ABN9E490_9NEOB|nr:unnamed protein product [Staurois parvus]
MFMFSWPSCRDYEGSPILCRCFYSYPEMVVSDAALFRRRRLQSSTRLVRLEL